MKGVQYIGDTIDICDLFQKAVFNGLTITVHCDNAMLDCRIENIVIPKKFNKNIPIKYTLRRNVKTITKYTGMESEEFKLKFFDFYNFDGRREITFYSSKTTKMLRQVVDRIKRCNTRQISAQPRNIKEFSKYLESKYFEVITKIFGSKATAFMFYKLWCKRDCLNYNPRDFVREYAMCYQEYASRSAIRRWQRDSNSIFYGYEF